MSSYHSNNTFHLGIDVGSTTIKAVLLDNTESVTPLFSFYQRHLANIDTEISQMLHQIEKKFDDPEIHVTFTGSAGMGIAERTKAIFVQEVIASVDAIQKLYPDVKTILDIGGEDSKLVLIGNNKDIDLRMNGNCAGGTGSFIDQMASLMGMKVEELDRLALKAKHVYPIAARCGVFAKTDVQNLLSKGIAITDIAKSIMHAVAYQVISSLSKSAELKGKFAFIGGPLSFFKSLPMAFIEILNIDFEEIFVPVFAKVIPAMGAAMSNQKTTKIPISKLIQTINLKPQNTTVSKKLKPLFKDRTEWETWKCEKNKYAFSQKEFINGSEVKAFLGVDSGSTTTKMVLISQDNEILFSRYIHNNGSSLQAFKTILSDLQKELVEKNVTLDILNSAVVGYGEELLKKAYNINHGYVETLAHYKAASFFEPDVSFILDIGGQDMKAVFVKNGQINKIEINEACSSGCGSFIENFSSNLDIPIHEFSKHAFQSKCPGDLGSRCTVFMNSKVKQSLREGASANDISAGLAYSIIKNCFTKVLRMSDFSKLGDKIVVQGGTFKNDAVLRAMENYIEKPVIRAEQCEMTGAFGAALLAKERVHKSTEILDFNQFARQSHFLQSESITCHGCENHCLVKKIDFSNENFFYTGNRCEKVFQNAASNRKKGSSIFAFKTKLLKEYIKPPKSSTEKKIVGIPLALNFYENLPFWITLFKKCGFNVLTSGFSGTKMAQKAAFSVMSDNICYPAKLMNAHVNKLTEKKPDFIFYPLIRHEFHEYKDAVNSYNCPVITGYPDVMRSTFSFDAKNIRLDTPVISFYSKSNLFKSVKRYLQELKVSETMIRKSFDDALKEWQSYKNKIISQTKLLIEKSTALDKKIVLLCGRPYHLDPLINQGIPDIITSMGYDVISEDGLLNEPNSSLSSVNVLSQWQYSNRIYYAAKWAASKDNVHMVQMNSFGCGPDTVVVDEARDIIESAGKILTVLRIDEISNTGSLKLRIRSSLESIDNQRKLNVSGSQAVGNAVFTKEYRKKIIIGPNLSKHYSLFIRSLFHQENYNFHLLPPSDEESAEEGQKYVNNDVCYPAILLIGDIMKAIKSGKYDTSELSVALSETGGQCRASNYVPLLKKALRNAGFAHIPVVSVATTPSNLNEQPGFKKNFFQLLSLSLSVLVYTDAILKMYHKVRLREKNNEQAEQVLNKFFSLAHENLGNYRIKNMLGLLLKAVTEFNEIETLSIPDNKILSVGIVGEIYMKYNEYGNNFLEDFLHLNKVEVTTATLNTFFLESLVDKVFNHKNFVERANTLELFLYKRVEKRIDKLIDDSNRILQGFSFGSLNIPKISQLANSAEKIVSLVNQFGEGWMLPGEIALFAEEGIHNIICVQPFGCIANHVVAKGVSAKIKSLFPNLNILFIDMDADSSHVNNQNRLELFLQNAKKQLKTNS